MANRRWIAPLGIVAALALLLAWWRPWHANTPTTPRLVALVPTPTPTTPARVTLPTARPRSSAPVATPATSSTPIAATPLPRAATPPVPLARTGRLIYLGYVSGSGGVVTSKADGSDLRLLLPGTFATLAVSPDGARFAVTSAIPEGGGAYQLAIHNADGRVLARYPFGRGTPATLTWSPSSRYLLATLPNGSQSQRWEIWVYSDDGARQITPPVPPVAFPDGWIPGDRLAFVAGIDPARPREQTLWTTDAAGGDLRRVFAWEFIPLSWNEDGSLLYALSYDRPDNPDANPTQLIAIDSAWGNAHHLASAGTLAVDALGLPETRDGYRFDFARPSPGGTVFAIGVAPIAGIGTPNAQERPRATSIIFMQLGGQITGVAHLPAITAPQPFGDMRGPGAWSPDGSRFALLVPGERAGDGQLLVFDIAGQSLVSITVMRAYSGNLPQLAWSRDSQWLAYTDIRGLSVATFTPVATKVIAPGGILPAWLP